MDIHELKAGIDNCNHFPIMPNVLTEILHLVNDGMSSASDVAKIVNQDQTLASKVLSLVNSAAYGLTYKVTSINEAVSLLGFNKVASLAVNSVILDKEQITKFDMTKFWQHTIATSIAAQFFAETTHNSGAAEMAGTIGLLHDIGKLFFMVHMPERYLLVQQEITKSEQISQVVERRILGVDHCQAGLLLARQWNWPKVVQEMLFHHHYPYKANMPHVCYFVYLANHVAHYVMNDLYPSSSITMEAITNPILAKKSNFPKITEDDWLKAQTLIKDELNFIDDVINTFNDDQS